MADSLRKKFAQLIYGIPGAFEKLPVFFDVLKAVLLWLAELAAFVAVCVLIVVGVLHLIHDDPLHGLAALGGCLMLLCLSLLMSLVMNPDRLSSNKSKKSR